MRNGNSLQDLLDNMSDPEFNRIYEEWKLEIEPNEFGDWIKFNRIYEEWKQGKLDICSTCGRVQSNLWGMETRPILFDNCILRVVQSNLWGMETKFRDRVSHVSNLFNRIYEEWKRGFDEIYFCTSSAFNRIYEEWKLHSVLPPLGAWWTFQSNLRGMETRESLSFRDWRREFQSNLRGMETPVHSSLDWEPQPSFNRI